MSQYYNGVGFNKVAEVPCLIAQYNFIAHRIVGAINVRWRQAFFGIDGGNNNQFAANVVKAAFLFNIGRSKSANAGIPAINQEDVEPAHMQT